MTDALLGSLARISSIDDVIAGAGFLVDPIHVVTCAHVVADALGDAELKKAPAAPQGRIAVDFFREKKSERVMATVDPSGWVAFDESRKGDIAVLRLDTAPSSGFSAPPLLVPPEVDGHRFSALGFPIELGDLVDHLASSGNIRVVTGPGSGWRQLVRDLNEEGVQLQHGFSGAAVWDHELNAVVGVAAAAVHQERVFERSSTHAGFMIPLDSVAAAWPPLKRALGWHARFDPALASHWDPRSRGVESASQKHDFFSGRKAVMDDLIGWLRETEVSSRVLTGWPGSGKSALLARVVMLSDPVTKARLTRESSSAADGMIENSIDVAIVGERKGVAQISAELARWLGVDGVSPEAVVDELTRRAAAGERVPVIVFDQLDEADRALGIVRELLKPLIENKAARLLIGLKRDDGDHGLLDELRGILDEIEIDEQNRLDPCAIADFVSLILAANSPAYAANPTALKEVSDQIAETAEASFLIARLMAYSLCDTEEIQTLGPDDFPGDIPGAVVRYIQRIAEDATANDEDQRATEARITNVLAALAYAEGSGLPKSGPVWAAIVSALSGRDYGPADVEFVCNSGARHIMQRTGANGQDRRLFHRALDNRLRADRGPLDDQSTIARGLIALCEAGEQEEADPYVAKHLSRHVLNGQPESWGELAAAPNVLDQLDPSSVRTDARRALALGRSLPAEIIGVLNSHHLLVDAAPGARRGLRQLGMARASGVKRFDSAGTEASSCPWSLKSAVLRQQAAHLTVQVEARVNCIATLVGTRGEVILIVGCADGRIRMLDSSSGDSLGEPFRMASAVCAVATHDAAPGPSFVASDDSGNVAAWSLETGKPDAIFQPYEGKRVRALALLALDDKLVVVTTDDDGAMDFWTTSGGILGRLEAHYPVNSVHIAATGEMVRVVAGGREGRVYVWEFEASTLAQPFEEDQLKRPAVLDGPGDWLHSVTVYERDNRTFVVAVGDDRKAWKWSLETAANSEVEEISGRDSLLVATSEQSIVATAGRDTTIRVWYPESGEGQQLNGHTETVRALAAFSVGDSVGFASGGDDCTVRIWSEESVDRLVDLDLVHIRAVRAVSVLRTGHDSIALTGADDGRVRGWNHLTGEPIGEGVIAFNGSVNAIAAGYNELTPDTAAVAGSEGTVQFVDVIRRTIEDRPLNGHSQAIRTLGVGMDSAGQRFIMTGGEDRSIRVWNDADRSEIVAKRRYFDGPIRSIAHQIDPAAPSQLLVVGDDRDAKLLDLNDPQSASTRFRGHTDWVQAVCVFPIHGLPGFATTGDDGRVFLWDPHGNRQAKLLGSHIEPARAVASIELADGLRRLVTGGDDGTVRVWNPEAEEYCRISIPLGAKINAICQIDDQLLIGTDEGHFVINVDWSR